MSSFTLFSSSIAISQFSLGVRISAASFPHAAGAVIVASVDYISQPRQEAYQNSKMIQQIRSCAVATNAILELSEFV